MPPIYSQYQTEIIYCTSKKNRISVCEGASPARKREIKD